MNFVVLIQGHNQILYPACADQGPSPLLTLAASDTYNTTMKAPAATLAHLAPEIRNEIYSLALASPKTFFMQPTQYQARLFSLRERSDSSSYEAIETMQVLGLVSGRIRQEVRTLFYASKHFFVLGYGYEYLPVFVRWLQVIGPDCLAVLRNLCMAGYMWYQPALHLTARLHHLLRMCENMGRFTIQLNIRHLCESCSTELDTYINTIPIQDGPMPRVNVGEWVKTILAMKRLTEFNLDFVASFDKAKVLLGEEKSFRLLDGEKGSALAKDIERRLAEELEAASPGHNVAVQVRYGGGDERTYYGTPWT
jgi:hypothetical protein